MNFTLLLPLFILTVADNVPGHARLVVRFENKRCFSFGGLFVRFRSVVSSQSLDCACCALRLRLHEIGV